MPSRVYVCGGVLLFFFWRMHASTADLQARRRFGGFCRTQVSKL
jgi:hypothetical protein